MHCLVDELCILSAKEKVTRTWGIIKRSSDGIWKIENLNEQFKRSLFFFFFKFYNIRPKSEVGLTQNQKVPDRSSSSLKMPSPHPSHRQKRSVWGLPTPACAIILLSGQLQPEGKICFSYFYSTPSGHRQGMYGL